MLDLASGLIQMIMGGFNMKWSRKSIRLFSLVSRAATSILNPIESGRCSLLPPHLLEFFILRPVSAMAVAPEVIWLLARSK